MHKKTLMRSRVFGFQFTLEKPYCSDIFSVNKSVFTQIWLLKLVLVNDLWKLMLLYFSEPDTYTTMRLYERSLSYSRLEWINRTSALATVFFLPVTLVHRSLSTAFFIWISCSQFIDGIPLIFSKRRGLIFWIKCLFRDHRWFSYIQSIVQWKVSIPTLSLSSSSQQTLSCMIAVGIQKLSLWIFCSKAVCYENSKRGNWLLIMDIGRSTTKSCVDWEFTASSKTDLDTFYQQFNLHAKVLSRWNSGFEL